MFENEIRELFDLCMRVWEETNAYVSFGINSSVGSTHVFIKDNGDDPKREFDGHYEVYSDCDSLIEWSREGYKNAKAHLERLLAEGRCGV